MNSHSNKLQHQEGSEHFGSSDLKCNLDGFCGWENFWGISQEKFTQT